jgi:hypothetical protein
MTDNKIYVALLIFVLVLWILAGISEVGTRQQKITNYQDALIITTACRLQPNINPDVICGKIPTWEQYK